MPIGRYLRRLDAVQIYCGLRRISLFARSPPCRSLSSTCLAPHSVIPGFMEGGVGPFHPRGERNVSRVLLASPHHEERLRDGQLRRDGRRQHPKPCAESGIENDGKLRAGERPIASRLMISAARHLHVDEKRCRSLARSANKVSHKSHFQYLECESLTTAADKRCASISRVETSFDVVAHVKCVQRGCSRTPFPRAHLFSSSDAALLDCHLPDDHPLYNLHRYKSY